MNNYSIINDDTTKDDKFQKFKGVIKKFEQPSDFLDNGDFLYETYDRCRGLASLQRDGSINFKKLFPSAKFSSCSFLKHSGQETAIFAVTRQTYFTGLFSISGKELIPAEYKDLFFSEDEQCFFGWQFFKLNGSTTENHYKFSNDFEPIQISKNDFDKAQNGNVIRIKNPHSHKYHFNFDGKGAGTITDSKNNIVGQILESKLPGWAKHEDHGIRVRFGYNGFFLITDDYRHQSLLGSNGFHLNESFVKKILGMPVDSYDKDAMKMKSIFSGNAGYYYDYDESSGMLNLHRADLSKIFQTLKDLGNGIFEINGKKFISTEINKIENYCNMSMDIDNGYPISITDLKKFGLSEVLNETNDMVEINGSKFKKRLLKLR